MITSLGRCQLSHQAFQKQLNSAINDFNTFVWKDKQPTSAEDVVAVMETLKKDAEEIEYLKSILDFYAYKIQSLGKEQENEECNKN